MDTATRIIKDLQAKDFAVPDAHVEVVAAVLAPSVTTPLPTPVAAPTTSATGSPLKRGPKKGTVSAFAYFRDSVALPVWYKVKEADKTADYKVWQAEHISARWNQIKADKVEFERYQALAAEETKKNQAKALTA